MPPDSKRMFTQATIKDVARAAGMDFTMVSPTLRGHPVIAARRCVPIKSAAHLLGRLLNERPEKGPVALLTSDVADLRHDGRSLQPQH